MTGACNAFPSKNMARVLSVMFCLTFSARIGKAGARKYFLPLFCVETCIVRVAMQCHWNEIHTLVRLV